MLNQIILNINFSDSVRFVVVLILEDYGNEAVGIGHFILFLGQQERSCC